MKPELVRFSSRPHPFSVHMTRCTNPACECSDVTFEVLEAVESDESDAAPIAFRVHIDSQTWEEIEPPTRLPEIARLVQEFLRDYPAAETAALQRACAEKRRIAERLKTYRIEPRLIREGTLVPFGEITHDRTGGKADHASFAYVFEHEGSTYLADDLFCPTPECACREVHLLFVKRVPVDGSKQNFLAEHRFLATFSLAGHAEVEHIELGTASEAQAVLSAWQEQYGDDIEQLSWRYEKVKEIARRSMVSQSGATGRYDLLSDEPLPVRTRVSRNGPCPCGSGRKFKKCCGKTGDLSLRPR